MNQSQQTVSTVARGCLASVNIGRPRPVAWGGSTVTTSIWKHPVAGRVPVRGVHLDGDDQADRSVHGGPDKALYAYGVDDYCFWSAELNRAVGPGSFGQNLTIDGLDISGAVIGERWQIGTAIFEVSQPRVPCYKLGIRMEDPAFPRRFAAAELVDLSDSPLVDFQGPIHVEQARTAQLRPCSELTDAMA